MPTSGAALTGKEMEYMVDSMSNEDLLIKQCAVAMASSANPQFRQLCSDMLQTHRRHYRMLMGGLEQQLPAAPLQP
ncbi:hypothetical protein B5M42_007485 [Paenibacillus athensensis]|uniref:Spore coat protein n=2 Tax=Paenibacillus athensensis TaxID=1967502 RepID=A0A4Y8Q2K8_9BACL|nr:hypothetical protein [Paenibacillus athensensis]